MVDRFDRLAPAFTRSVWSLEENIRTNIRIAIFVFFKLCRVLTALLRCFFGPVIAGTILIILVDEVSFFPLICGVTCDSNRGRFPWIVSKRCGLLFGRCLVVSAMRCCCDCDRWIDALMDTSDAHCLELVADSLLPLLIPFLRGCVVAVLAWCVFHRAECGSPAAIRPYGS